MHHHPSGCERDGVELAEKLQQIAMCDRAQSALTCCRTVGTAVAGAIHRSSREAVRTDAHAAFLMQCCVASHDRHTIDIAIASVV